MGLFRLKVIFDEGMQVVKDVAKKAQITIVNSITPYRWQGQKTSAFEIMEELECAPDLHGLKASDTAIKQSTKPMATVEATMDAVKKAILDNMAD